MPTHVTPRLYEHQNLPHIHSQTPPLRLCVTNAGRVAIIETERVVAHVITYSIIDNNHYTVTS